MTLLALNLSWYVNGVAKRHAEVSRLMFAPYVIDAVTNGVHAATWVSPPLADVSTATCRNGGRTSFLSDMPLESRGAKCGRRTRRPKGGCWNT